MERSADGEQFVKLGAVQESAMSRMNNDEFGFPDVNPVKGENYYRIKYTDHEATVHYSKIVKLTADEPKPAISIYPNPVTGNRLQLWFTGMPGGVYQVSIYNTAGQRIHFEKIQHDVKSVNEIIVLRQQVSKGKCLVEITAPDGGRTSEGVIIN